MDTPIKILVVGNRLLVREGVTSWMASEPELQIVGEATNGDEAITATMKYKPDVTLMDFTLPVNKGIETVRQIMNNDPNSKILVLVSIYEEEKIIQAMIAGAIGFIQDDVSQHEMVDAIQMVFHNQAWLSLDLTRVMVKSISPLLFEKTTPSQLTEGESDVAKLVAKGLSNSEIAEAMQLSRGAVRYYINNVFNKLHLKNRTQLALYTMHDNSTQ